MMFEKQFYTILPDEHTNERIEDILAKRGLKHRIVTQETDLQSVLSEDIDYSSLQDYSHYVDRSREYLKKALSD